MKALLFSLFVGLCSSPGWAQTPCQEDERLQGFDEHMQKRAEMNQERLAGADEVRKKRQAWQEEQQQTLPEYKKWKSEQKAAVDENSPEYFEDLKRRQKLLQEMETARLEYLKEKPAKRAQTPVLCSPKISPEHELGLDQPFERAEISKRALYGGGSASIAAKRTARGSGAGSMEFGSPPSSATPPEYTPAPPPTPNPEFFEPEAPPPPPPMPPEFEDPIPPPVFDDAPPEF